MLLIRLSGTLVPMSSMNSAGGTASWADSRPAMARVVASIGRIDIQNTPSGLALYGLTRRRLGKLPDSLHWTGSLSPACGGRFPAVSSISGVFLGPSGTERLI